MPSTTTVITGATSGIGKETTRALARQGHVLYLLVRNINKGERLKKELAAETGNNDIHIIGCDVSDLLSVQQAADELIGKVSSINILINNAGSAFTKRQLSADGYEMSFALNHLGHFLLTKLLLPLLIKGQARVINVSSDAHKNAQPNFDDLQLEHGYKVFKAYGLSKLYNIYFTKSLNDKYRDQGITSYALHPGVVSTNIWNKAEGIAGIFLLLLKPFMITAEKGAETVIYLATEKGIEDKSGQYFKKKQVTQPSAAAEDVASRDKLWNVSELLINKSHKTLQNL